MEIITTLHPQDNPDDELYPNIKEDNIPLGAVTTSKLANDSVTSDKLANESVTPDKVGFHLYHVHIVIKPDGLNFTIECDFLTTNNNINTYSDVFSELFNYYGANECCKVSNEYTSGFKYPEGEMDSSGESIEFTESNDDTFSIYSNSGTIISEHYKLLF